MQRGATGRYLNRFQSLVAVLLLPLVLFHLAWLTPVVQWSCLCPDDDVSHRCCCNCPKCVKHRGGFLSYCHLGANGIEQGFTVQSPATGHSVSSWSSSDPSGHGQDGPALSFCPCNSHIKEISLDVHPFLLQETSNGLRSSPIVGILLTHDCWPPEADPCQPDRPG